MSAAWIADSRQAVVESLRVWAEASTTDSTLPVDVEKRVRELERLEFTRIAVLGDTAGNLDCVLLHQGGTVAAQVPWFPRTEESATGLTSVLASGTARGLLCTGTIGGTDAWAGSLRQVFDDSEPEDLLDYHHIALEELEEQGLSPIELDPESVTEYRSWGVRMEAVAVEQLPEESLLIVLRRLRHRTPSNKGPLARNPSTPAKVAFLQGLWPNAHWS